MPKRPPPPLWPAMTLSFGGWSGIFGSALVAAGLSVTPISRTTVVAGSAIAFLGVFLGPDGLFWALRKRFTWHLENRADNTENGKLIAALEARLARTSVDIGTAKLMGDIARADLNNIHMAHVRRLAVQFLLLDSTGGPIYHHAERLFMAEPLDLVSPCEAVTEMMKNRSRYEKQIEAIVFFIDGRMGFWTGSQGIGSANLDACERLAMSHADLPRRKDIQAHVAELRELQGAAQDSQMRPGIT